MSLQQQLSQVATTAAYVLGIASLTEQIQFRSVTLSTTFYGIFGVILSATLELLYMQSTEVLPLLECRCYFDMQVQDEIYSKTTVLIPLKGFSFLFIEYQFLWSFWSVGWEGKLTGFGIFNRWLTHLVTVWHQLCWRRQRLLLVVWMALFALLTSAMAGASVFCGSPAVTLIGLKECLWQVFWSKSIATLIVYLDCL